MNAPAPAVPRSEPLLWIQLLGLGALPLEALLILLLLAGSEPGPWPWLERGLAWSLGALAPSVLLWRRPADVWSLLLLATPLRGRRDCQRRLSALQQALAPRLGLLLGAASLLPLFAWLDRWSVLASEHALIPEAPRLAALLCSIAVLAVMLWQWQQLLQSLWLLSRSASAIAAAPPLSPDELGSTRLCLGLPLLLPDPLRFEAPRRDRGDQGRPQPPLPPETAASPPPPATTAPALVQPPDSGVAADGVGADPWGGDAPASPGAPLPAGPDSADPQQVAAPSSREPQPDAPSASSEPGSPAGNHADPAAEVVAADREASLEEPNSQEPITNEPAPSAQAAASEPTPQEPLATQPEATDLAPPEHPAGSLAASAAASEADQGPTDLLPPANDHSLP